jgi:uncharacterized membrane protein YdjX (TVP38/TMEM64 family)
MRRHKKKILLIALFLALIGITWYFGGDTLTFEGMKKNREAFHRFVKAHYLLSVAAFIGIDLLSALFLPGALVLTLIGGFLFGVVWGIIYVMIGMTLGASLAFLFARYIAGKWIHSRYEDHLEKFNREIARHGSSYLLMLRLIPVLPFFVVNFLAGMTKMSLKRFLLTTAVGVLPGSVVYTYAGQQFGSIRSLDDIMTPKLVIAFVLLGTLALLPVVFRLLKQKFPSQK